MLEGPWRFHNLCFRALQLEAVFLKFFFDERFKNQAREGGHATKMSSE